MKSNFKTFSHKLIALFIAIVMVVSSFTGVVTVFAAEGDARNFHDDNLAANFMTWAETTDEQTAEALLDWVDLYLGDLLTGLLGSNEIHFEQNIVIATISLHLYLDSVDGLIDALRQAQGLLNSYGGLIGGDVNNVNLSALPNLPSVTSGDQIISKCGRSYRASNSAKTILMALAQTLVNNANDQTGNKNVIGQFIKGQLNLGGILNGVLGSDVFTLLKDKVFNSSLGLNLWSGYQNNLVYNLVAEIIFYKTNWYSESEIQSFESYLQGNGGTKWNYDDQLFSKLSTELLANINAEITYPGNLSHEVGEELKDTSRTRYAEIQEYIENNGGDIASASLALGYDPNLKYTSDGNIYLFQYEGLDNLSIRKDSKLVQVATDALRLAWNTALKPTVGIVHVNYDAHDEGHGTNFDNNFYYWMMDKGLWNSKDWKSNYSDANVKAWATAMAPEYKAKNADEFLGFVRETFDWDRNVVDTPENSWKDIDSTKLWGKLRYNPLADLYFNMQTGPLNLYFMETGAPHITAFLDSAINDAQYSDTIVSMANDVLVAAVKDFFPNSDNIGLGDGQNNVTTSLSLPEMTKTNVTSEIGSTVVLNALKVFEYAANATDENILNAFYSNHSITNKSTAYNLTEENFEESMIPFLIAALQNISFAEMIHDEKWDACKDAEGVAFVALEEYLSYVLPNKDYSKLAPKTNGKYDVELEDIEIMARDAVGYLLSSIVPCRDKNGNEWNVYDAPVNNDVTIYEILNSVVCYYASMDNYRDPSTGKSTTGKGVASLLGVVDSNGNCLVKGSNSLWQNLDAVVNKLLPILGTFLNGREASVSTEDLLYNKIIKGILDIGPNHGVTTILEQIITIFTAEPTTKGIDEVVYDFLAQEINALFGSRGVNGMTMSKVVPRYADLKSTTPFDTFVNSNVLAKFVGANGKEDGVIGCLLQSLFEILGGNNKSAAQAKGAWTGAMFAVKAVNNFIPSFVPQLSEHKFQAATVSIPNASQTGVVPGQKMAATNLEFKNNCIGLNRFWRDEHGNLNQDDRYFINVTDVTYTDERGNVPSNFNLSTYSKGAIAPESSIKIGLTGNYAPGTQLIKFVVTYNVFEGKGTPTVPAKGLYNDLKATCYLYLSSENSWQSDFYNATVENSDILYNNGNLLTAQTHRTDKAPGSNMILNAFNTFLISSADPASMNTAGIAITADGGSGGVDAIYSYIAEDAADAYITNYDSTIVYDPDSCETSSRDDIVSEYGDATQLAYANFDKATGDVLNIDLRDYRLSPEDDWTNGVTEAAVNTALENAGYPEDAEVRTHIAYTLEDGIDNGIIKAVEKDGDSFVNVYVDPAYLMSNDGNAPEITAATQVPGINMVPLYTGSINSATVWKKWLRYDGSTTLQPQTFNMNIAILNSAGPSATTTKVIISNDSEANALMNQYNTNLREMAPYSASDFKDYDDSDPKFPVSETYNKLQTAFQNVVKAVSTPVTLASAEGLASTYVNTINTAVTTSETGDIAYKPLTEDADKTAFLNNATVIDGIYYRDAEGKQPMYSNELLTDADVVDGMDAAGQAVVKKADGNYYLANARAKEYEWKYTGMYKDAPYYGKTDELAVNEAGDPLYDQVQYQYYTADGTKVGSGDDWAYKFSISHSAIKENDATNDYRGYYQKQMDSLAYRVQEARSMVNGKIAAEIGVKVMEDRQGKDSVNYDVATYEKMVRVAKSGESLINATKDEESGTVEYSTSASKVEVDEAVRIYEIYRDRVIGRGYEGNAIEKEILCATGAAHTTFTATEATETTPAVVTTTAKSVRFGAVKGGELVNEGDVVYTAKTWTAYVNALAHAVALTAEKPEEALSSVYGAKKELQIAENNLEVDATVTVSGTIYKAADANGTTKIDGDPLAGAEIIVDGEVVATTAEDGTFTAIIANDTTEVTISGENVIARTVSVDATAPISGAEACVVAFDFDNNGKINTIDATLASSVVTDNKEANAFKKMFNKKVVYATASLNK